MSTHAFAVRQPQKLLTNVLAWLDKAEAHAAERGFDPEVFLEARLVADMFPLRRQIQAATDAAKFIAARGAGVVPPKHPDDETTLAQLRTRIQSVVYYLGTIDEAKFAGIEDRIVTLPFLPEGKGMTAVDYIIDMGLPNFMFHLTAIYAILRKNGVAIGKRDFLGAMTLIDV